MYSKDIFASCFTLAFKDKKLGLLYQKITFQTLKRYNFLLCCYFFGLLILSSTFLFYYKVHHLEEENKALDAITYYAIGYIVLSLVLTILNFIKKENYFFLKMTCYLNGIFCFFAFSFFRYYILFLLELDISLFYLMHFLEFISRIILIFTGLLGFLDTLLMSFLIICCFFTFYSPNISWWKVLPYSFILYIIFSAFFVVFSYFIAREKRKSFYYDYILKKNVEWYENIFDKSSFGFLKISNEKILFANRLMKTKLFAPPEMIMAIDPNQNENCNEALKRRSTTVIEIGRDFSKLIDELFSHVELTELIHEGGYNFNSSDISFLEMIKPYYVNKGEENFIHLGVKTYQIQNYSSNEEIMYEILFRYYINDDTGKDNYEFIFNDITRTREIEKRNAEFKYKALFLAKVAHEFKNPLICISELVEKCNEISNEMKTSSIRVSEFSFNLEQNLNLINSLSNYMVILTKDLDYFSRAQVKGMNVIQKESTNLDGLLNFVNEVCKGLVVKLNKQSNMKFLLHKGENVPDYISTDEVKLKQVLINLCSNGIKFTSKGSVELSVEKEGEFLNFIVEDTGIGMAQERMEQIFKPFSADINSKNLLGTGLGLSIVSEITAMFGCPVQLSSTPGKGSKFWFKLPIAYDDKTIEIDQELGIDDTRQMAVQIISSPSRLPRHDPISLSVSYDTVVRDDIVLGYDYSKPIETKQYNVIIADDDIFVRNSAVRVLLKAAKSLNIELNLTEVEDGIDILYNIYNGSKVGVSTHAIISDETMRYLNGSEALSILNQLSRDNKISSVNFNLVTAYETCLLSIGNTYSKPMTMEIATTILTKLLSS